MKRYVVFILCTLFAINIFAYKERWDKKREDWTPLMRAVYCNQVVLRDSLIHAGVDVNESSKRQGMTALTVAIRKQAVGSVKVLLETDRITDVNRYVITACSNQDVDIVKLLVEYGAEIDTVDQNGYTPLMAAVSFGSAEIVEFLLNSKVNMDQQQGVGSLTALMLAVYNGQVEKVKLLVEYGANKNITNSDGKRAYNYIDYAISIGRISEEDREKLQALLE